MTDTPPELPSGDDPWTLLGVSPDADRRTIKRAYTRLIRIYKPERHPAEFQRIRAAYEALRDGGDGAAPSPPDGVHEPLPEMFAGTPLDDPNVAVWSLSTGEPGEWQDVPPPLPDDDDPWLATEVWNDAAAGEVYRAHLRLRDLTAERDPHVADFAHHYLLDELADDLHVADAHLDAALTARVPISTWARATLGPEALNRVTVRDAFSWSTLREQPDRQAAAALYHFRSDELLMRGRLDVAVAEVSDREFRREALDDDQLRHVPISVASALIWDDLERGLELFDTFAAEVRRDEDGGSEDLFLHVRRAAEAWHGWRGRFDAPAAFRRFLQLRVVVDPGQRRRLAKALLGDFLDRPTDYATFLEGFAKSGADLVSFHAYAIWEEHLFDDEGELVLPDPGPAAATATGHAAAAIDRELEQAGANKLSSLVLLGHLVAIVLGFVFFGWWGLISLVVLLVTGLFSIAAFDRRLYRQSVRPTIVRLIAEQELHPSQVVAQIQSTKGALDEVARFQTEISEDTTLHQIYLLARLRRYA